MDIDSAMIMKRLDEYDGVLPFNDKADPKVIEKEFGISKNAFKRAVGRLLKAGKINITEKSIQKIGLCYQQLEDYSSALAHYNQALLYNGDDVWTLSRKAFCEYKLGNLAEAKSTMIQIIELDPDNITIRKKLANLSLSEKDYDTALKQLYYLE